MFSKFIGDKPFYDKVLKIAFPLVIQQLLMSTFSIVDTLMVGSIYRGVAGVGIAAQVSSVIMTIMFGINSGITIYLAQFYGAKDYKNMKNSFALGLSIICFVVGTLSLMCLLFPEPIIRIFSKDLEVINVAMPYLKIVALSFLPNSLAYCFSYALRVVSQTKPSLYINVCASLINVCFNYLLIFGIAFFPTMGVAGAAIATLISNIFSLIAHIWYSKKTEMPFLPKLENLKLAFRKRFALTILKTSSPLIVNELFFSIGTSLYVVFINTYGSNAYEGYRIAESVANIMFSVSFGLSTAVMVMVGETLGAKDFARASKMGSWFFGLAVAISVVTFTINFLLAPFFVSLFNNDIEEVVINATRILKVYSLRIACRVFVVMLFATFRAGGESKFVMLLDAGVLWVVGIPLAYLMSNVIHIADIAVFYLILQLEQIVRIVIGLIKFKKRTWVRNVAEEIS